MDQGSLKECGKGTCHPISLRKRASIWNNFVALDQENLPHCIDLAAKIFLNGTHKDVRKQGLVFSQQEKYWIRAACLANVLC